MRSEPFLKWAGGKRQLLPELARHLPGRFGTYWEPFLGGGALFFHLQPARAVLLDANPWLMRTYRAIRDQVEEVITTLQQQPNHPEHFAQLAAQVPDPCDEVGVATWFIYLNRTAFNGLWRMNSAGRFNAPYGDGRSNPCDAERLRACSHALRRARLGLQDFSVLLELVRAGDFVYFDPPYVPVSVTANFRGYTREGFGGVDQARLRDVVITLKARGVGVLVSQSDTPLVRELYGPYCELLEVRAQRRIGGHQGRAVVGELLIR